MYSVFVVSIKQFSEFFRVFLRAKSGGVAVISALLLLPLSIAGGSVVDYNHAVKIQRHLQHATDAATMAAAKEPLLSYERRNELVYGTIDGNLKAQDISLPFTFSVFAEDGLYKVVTEASVDTAFMRLAGLDKLDIKVTAAVIMSYDVLEGIKLKFVE